MGGFLMRYSFMGATEIEVTTDIINEEFNKIVIICNNRHSIPILDKIQEYINWIKEDDEEGLKQEEENKKELQLILGLNDQEFEEYLNNLPELEDNDLW
jgi:hypothetical protein